MEEDDRDTDLPALYKRPQFDQDGNLLHHWKIEAGDQYPVRIQYTIPDVVDPTKVYIGDDEQKIVEIVKANPLRQNEGISEARRRDNVMLPDQERLKKRTEDSRATNNIWANFLNEYNQTYEQITSEAFYSTGSNEGAKEQDEANGQDGQWI